MPSTMTAKVSLVDGMSFLGETASGHELTLDAAAEVGGKDAGPRPIELFLLGLGGCTGMDVISILRKMRQDVTGYELNVRGERVDEHPRVFTRITVEHVVRGRGLNEQSVARAVDLSATRYCPASAMLSKAAEVVHTFRLVEESAGAG